GRRPLSRDERTEAAAARPHRSRASAWPFGQQIRNITPLAEISHFTQPDHSPTYFIDFLDFLDSQPEVARVRIEAEVRLDVMPGGKVVDVGCGIGGATFRIAEHVTGTDGLAAGVD